MPDRPKESKAVDVSGLVGKDISFEVRTAETKDERESRLRREEAEDAYKRRISLAVHIFVMAIVAIAFSVSSYIAVTGDPKSGLTEKSMNIITVIVAAGVGFITGQGEQVDDGRRRGHLANARRICPGSATAPRTLSALRPPSSQVNIMSSAFVSLHRARLFRDQAEFARARDLIEKHGYGRRQEELEGAEAAARNWPAF